MIGKEGNEPCEFHEPIVIAIYHAGFIYVTDAGNHRIQKLSQEGRFTKTWGSKGTGDGELDRPMHMNFDQNGKLYVAEFLNDRIQVFDRN